MGYHATAKALDRVFANSATLVSAESVYSGIVATRTLKSAIDLVRLDGGMIMKLVIGFALAFGIGAICRLARIPSPAPNAIVGALLVASMSTGYVLTERWLGRRPSKIVSSAPRPHGPSVHGESSCK